MRKSAVARYVGWDGIELWGAPQAWEAWPGGLARNIFGVCRVGSAFSWLGSYELTGQVVEFFGSGWLAPWCGEPFVAPEEAAPVATMRGADGRSALVCRVEGEVSFTMVPKESPRNAPASPWGRAPVFAPWPDIALAVTPHKTQTLPTHDSSGESGVGMHATIRGRAGSYL